MRLRSGDKHNLRKSADRKAQISLVSRTNAFLICAFRSADFLRWCLSPERNLTHNLFFQCPIVFGINLIHFFDEKDGSAENLIACIANFSVLARKSANFFANFSATKVTSLPSHSLSLSLSLSLSVSLSLSPSAPDAQYRKRFRASYNDKSARMTTFIGLKLWPCCLVPVRLVAWMAWSGFVIGLLFSSVVHLILSWKVRLRKQSFIFRPYFNFWLAFWPLWLARDAGRIVSYKNLPSGRTPWLEFMVFLTFCTMV